MLLIPFKWIVELFFTWSNALFNDPGWAVVGMSIMLSLLLTPLYVWIERRKNADKAKSAPMQAEIDKIEAVYTGRERFYYTREIQRRYKYSPWAAMIPTLGLLVQIPFLLAAYHYLSELPIFSGVSFLYIKDLAKPDTIATVGGLPINLLAILMTLINLVSGWRYAESGKPKERIQYMAVAAIFLFLLYNCAASVVLYWTLSNALSFARSEIFFRSKVSKDTSSSFFSSEKIFIVAKYVCIYFLFLVAILGADAELLSASSAPNSGMLLYRLYSAITMVMLVPTAIVAFVVTWRSSLGQKPPCFFNFILALIVFLLLVPFMHRYLGLPISESPIAEYLFAMGEAFSFVLSVVLVAMSWKIAFPASSSRAVADNSKYYGVGLCAVLGLSIQLLLCGPICAYASCPERAGDVTLASLAGRGVAYTLVSVGGAWLVIRFLSHKASRIFVALLFFVFVVAFAYGNLIPYNYGVLFQGRYANEAAINPNADKLIVEAICLSVVFVAAFFVPNIIRQKSRLLTVALLLISFSFLCRIGFSVMRMPDVETTLCDVDSQSKLFRFSKTGRNIVFLLLDSYIGHRFGDIIDSNKDLKEAFDGFTYYPNTISVGTYTFPSMPALWAGEEYSPSNIDKTRKLGELYVESWNVFASKVKKAGYRLATSLICNGYRGKVNGAERMWHEMLYQSSQKRFNSNEGRVDLSALNGNAFMCALPLVFRPLIYDSGRWHEKEDPFDPTFNFMEDLIVNSAIVDDPQGVFVKIHSETTHHPHLTRENGVNKKKGADPCFYWSTEQVAKWLRWMKSQGVYDNTRIVLCSDHGSPMSNSERKWYLNQRYAKNVEKMQSAVGTHPGGDVHSYFALLAVKDFGSCGSVKTDLRTKTVSHGAYFAFDDSRFDEPVKEIVTGYIVCPPDWREKKGFVVTKKIKITGDASDGKNWNRIEE